MRQVELRDEILLERRDNGVAVVTINRPAKRNACNQAAWRGIGRAFRTLAQDGGVRLGVLTGAGGHFCAGDDVLDYAAVRNHPVDGEAYRADIRESYAAIMAAPFPVIAAISGYCVGGAVSLCFSCDFRVATPDARFGIPPGRLGQVYPAEQCQRLAALVGLTEARRLLFTAEQFDAAHARRIGLLDALADGDPVDEAIRFAEPMSNCAPLSIAGTKLIFNAIAAGRVDQQAETIAAAIRRADESEDIIEGARAFAERRRPRFRGR